MAQSTAERQAAYRKRRPTAGENGERRISTWVTTGAALALARLARREGVSQRAVLERLIRKADEAVVARLDPNGPEWEAYFGRDAVTGRAAATRGRGGARAAPRPRPSPAAPPRRRATRPAPRS